MTAKLNPLTAAPSLMKEWHRTSVLISSSLEPGLSELVKIHASHINGCAYCLDRHMVGARAHGETEERIYQLSAWREAPCYTDRERAALGWTEALTRLSEGHTHESAYESLKAHFTDEEQVKLTLLINGQRHLTALSMQIQCLTVLAILRLTNEFALEPTFDC